MRPVFELVGRAVVWASLLWLFAFFVLPVELRPLAMCQPVVWTTRSIARLTSSADDVRQRDRSDVFPNLQQECTQFVELYFSKDPGR